MSWFQRNDFVRAPLRRAPACPPLSVRSESLFGYFGSDRHIASGEPAHNFTSIHSLALVFASGRLGSRGEAAFCEVGPSATPLLASIVVGPPAVWVSRSNM